ncbi:MAG: PilW family protein [Candidatus Binatia bacterium]
MQLTARVRTRLLDQQGFTLMEVLVASTLSLVALAGFLSFNRGQLFTLRNQANQLDLQTTARNIVDLFAREVRRAGMNPGCGIPGFSGIAAATASSLRIQADLNGDGLLTAPNEDITYHYVQETTAVERIDHNGVTDVLVSGVDLNGCVIRYFDQDGAELVPGGTGLNAGERASIRRIRVELTLAGAAVDPTNTLPLRAQVATDVDLRNRYFVNQTACP